MVRRRLWLACCLQIVSGESERKNLGEHAAGVGGRNSERELAISLQRDEWLEKAELC